MEHRMHVETLSHALGARITNVDLRGDLNAEVARAITAAFFEHGVLVFPDQRISDAEHVRFARLFGTPQIFNARDATPEIFRSGNVDVDGRLFEPQSLNAGLLRLNWLWHSDASYRPIPTTAVVLRAVRGACEGGDTLFANMAAAYQALPLSERQRIEPLVGRHSFEFMVGSQGLPALDENERLAFPVVEHPLVRRHAGGRTSLFLSPPYMECVVGKDESESRALIDELTQWATQDRFTCRHQWQQGDVLVWDNRWTMHKVAPYDMGRIARVMHGAALN
jgi:alpha-ketoglutarate-dependent taurine dioxygenase